MKFKKKYRRKKFFRKKGDFLHPIIYNFAKSRKKIFIFEKNINLNIRSSVFLKKFSDKTFYVHNGKSLILNDSTHLRLILRKYKKFYFKIGQFSYNRHILEKRTKVKGLSLIYEDLKRKKGIILKIKKKNKYIYSTL